MVGTAAGASIGQGDAAGVDREFAPRTGRTPRSVLQRWCTIAYDHPLLVVTALGILVAALNLWWVLHHRDLGAYNVDEAGYMSRGFRLHSSLDPSAPGRFVDELLSPSPTGPLVPVLSVPLLVLGPRSVSSMMALQSLIVVVAATAAAACAHRIGGQRAALSTGVLVLASPAVIGSARSFQYASAMSACLLLALWALLASDRGRRRPQMLGFGAAVGAMLLARTMAVAILPAVGIGAVVVVRWDRRGRWNAVLAAIVAVLVAGPWWWSSRVELWDYLFRFGYGDQADLYGSDTVLGRVGQRLVMPLADFRLPTVLLGAAASVLVIVDLVRWRRSGRPLGEWPAARRDVAALVVVVLFGYLALLSSSNHGVWFELPLELVALTTVVSVASAVRIPARRALGSAALALAVLTFGISLADRGGRFDGHDPFAFVQGPLLTGGLYEWQGEGMRTADARFASDDASARRAMANDWWGANERLAHLVEERRRACGDLLVTMSGSSPLLNTQDLLLAQDLLALPSPAVEVPDTRAPDRALEPYLAPRPGGACRLLVVIHPLRGTLFNEDRQVDRFDRLADRAGWRPWRRLALPDGGTLTVLDHPGPAAR